MSMALLALLAAAPQPVLELKLVWEEAEHSMDASSSESTFILVGDTLTHSSERSGREEPMPKTDTAKSPVKLTAQDLEEVRALLVKLAKLSSVRALPKGFQGRVKEISLDIKDGAKTKNLTVQVRADDEKSAQEQLAVLSELHLVFARRIHP